MKNNNNFDFLRFLFASLVVISHSFPLSGVLESDQWISQVTNKQMVFSTIGLDGFFVISGYFIFQSVQKSESILDFFKKRISRIFPGLFVALVLSTIFAICFLYEGKTPWFKNLEVYTYIPYNLSMIHFQSGIKGVFDTNFYHSINGSLWTIRYEFALYVFSSFIFFFKDKINLIRWVLFITSLFLLICFNFFLDVFAGVQKLGFLGINVLNLGTFFVIGSLLSSFKINTIPHKKIYVFGLMILLLFAIYFNFFSNVQHVFLSFAILFFGFSPIKGIKDFGKYGDPSYGIYIYSFPIQQILVYYFKLNAINLCIISLSLSIIFGYLSWHLIEKKFIKRLKLNEVKR